MHDLQHVLADPATREKLALALKVNEELQATQEKLALALKENEELQVTREKLALALKVNEELQAATVAAQAECAKLQNELAAYQFSSSELEQV
jgi:hypothetical protein